MRQKLLNKPRKKLKKRNLNRSLSGDITLFLVLFLMGLVMLLPIVIAVSNALKPLDELFVFPPRFIVRHPTSENFRDVFRIMADSWIPFSRYIFNTIFVTAVGVSGHVVLASLAAYAFAKHKVPFANGMFNLVVTALMFSGYVTQIPNYLTMKNLGWLDSYLALVVPALASPLGLFLMKQFMEQIPDSILESARMDGASEWYIFWKMVMPNVRPAWLTLIIFAFQDLWNATGSTYIYSEQLKTLPYALSQISAGTIARAGVSAAVSVLMMVVPVTVFIVTQSNIIETMSTSGIKE